MVRNICNLAEEAGHAILDIYGKTTIAVTDKADLSPLTEADRAANGIICRYLAQHYPDIPVISEENREEPFAIRREYKWCWMVDPLDGTREFLAHNGDFTVNIALIRGGEPLLGVVYVPVSGDLSHAIQGGGAYLREGGEVRPLATRPFSLQSPGLRVVASRSHLSAETSRFISHLDSPVLVSRGSSLKFLMLATGLAEVYPRLSPTSEWDTAAAQCILVEAGGRVQSYLEGKPLRYNKENLRNPHFVAYAHWEKG